MRKGVTKKKFCISLDIDIYEKLERICNESDAKMSTKINSLISQALKKKR